MDKDKEKKEYKRQNKGRRKSDMATQKSDTATKFDFYKAVHGVTITIITIVLTLIYNSTVEIKEIVYSERLETTKLRKDIEIHGVRIADNSQEIKDIRISLGSHKLDDARYRFKP